MSEHRDQTVKLKNSSPKNLWPVCRQTADRRTDERQTGGRQIKTNSGLLKKTDTQTISRSVTLINKFGLSRCKFSYHRPTALLQFNENRVDRLSADMIFWWIVSRQNFWGVVLQFCRLDNHHLNSIMQHYLWISALALSRRIHKDPRLNIAFAKSSPTAVSL